MLKSLDTPIQYVKGVGPKVAKLLSKLGINTVEDLIYFFPRDYEDRRNLKPISELVPFQPEIIKAEIAGITIVNTYIPQGHSPESEKFIYKLDWFKRLGDYFACRFKPTEPIIWLGDFNIAPEAKDVHDPVGLAGSVCFHPDVQKALQKIMDWGFVDVFRKHCDEPGRYTFWDYRVPNGVKRNLGWRLDHIMATEPLAQRCSACYIDKEPRLAEKPSDHTFLVAEFD